MQRQLTMSGRIGDARSSAARAALRQAKQPLVGSLGSAGAKVEVIVPMQGDLQGREAWLTYLNAILHTAPEDNSISSARWDATLFSYVMTAERGFLGFAASATSSLRVTEMTAEMSAHLVVYVEWLLTLVPVGQAQTVITPAACPTGYPHKAEVDAAMAFIDAQRLNFLARGDEWPLLLHACAPTYYDAMAAQAEFPHALMGIFMFTAGKKITLANITAVTEKRPKAIRTTLEATQGSDELAALEGTRKWSAPVWIRANACWSRHPEMRKLIISMAFSYVGKPSNSMVNAMVTTVQFIAWQGMAHVGLIFDFLEAHPRAATLPTLAADVGRFLAEYEALDELDEHEIPIMRVIFGSSLPVLRQSSVRELYGVALQEARNSPGSTLTNYAPVATAQPAHSRYTTAVTAATKRDTELKALLISQGLVPPEDKGAL